MLHRIIAVFYINFFDVFYFKLCIYDIIFKLCGGKQLLDPHPAVVATKLLARKKFIDNGKQFNMIACSWIQFMIHDWTDHLEDSKQVYIHLTSQINKYIIALCYIRTN